MHVLKLNLKTEGAMPLIAALPYAVAIDNESQDAGFAYNPRSQLATFAASRDFSTSREDESIWGLFSKSRSDTKKDD